MNTEIKKLEERFKQIEKKINDKQSKPLIAVSGLVNAGKSYLLNMLTQNIDQEYFKTADQRETSANKRFETEQYIYLDTPGLDAQKKDDEKAQEGIDEADIVLFVHQPQGEFDPSEIGFLKQLQKNFKEHAHESIVIVISKIDKENEEKIKAIEQKIMQQCQEHLGFKPTIFQVSNTRYQKGLVEHKAGLVHASHMDLLAQHLQKVASSATHLRKDKLSLKLDSLHEEIDRLSNELHEKQQTIRQEVIDSFDEFNKEIDSLKDFLEKTSKNFANFK